MSSTPHSKQIGIPSALIPIIGDAVESLNEGLAISDPTLPDNPIIYVNKGFERITGYTFQEVVGKNSRFLQGTEKDQPGLKVLRTAISEQTACQVRLKNFRKDGSYFWNDFRLSPVFDEQHTLKYWVGIQTEITDQVNANEALETVAFQRKQLMKITQKILAARSQQDVFNVVAQGLNSVITYDAVAIYMVHSDKQMLVPLNIVGPEVKISDLSHWSISLDQGIIGSVLQSDHGVMINNAHLDPRSVYPPEQKITQEHIIVQPLKSGERTWGAFVINRTSDMVFQNEEFEIIQFMANYVSLAIENLSLISRLRSSEETQRTVLETISDAVITIDQQGTIHYVNEGITKIFGYAQEEILRKNMTLLVPSSLRDAHRKGLDRYTQTNRRNLPSWHSVRLPGLRKDGTEVPLEISFGETRTPEKKFYTGIMRDITVRLQKEVEIESLSRFPAENPSPIFRISREYKILYANTPGRAMLHEIDNQDDKWIPTSWKPIIDRCFELHRTMEFEIPSIDGSKVYLCSFVPFEPSGYINMYARDISELKHAAWELMKAKQSAEESVRIKQDFLAKMSHELRTPMNGVLGLTNLLLQTDISKDQLKLLKGIKTSGDGLLSIINDVLDLAKIEAGKMEIRNELLNLKNITENVRIMFKPIVEKKKINFDVHYTLEDVSGLIGDEVRINQIILNLVGNAVKFTNKGGVSVAFEKVMQDSATILRITVSDTGIGMSKEEQQYVFQSFSQASRDISIRYGGTGLGLTIVQQLIGLMHGSITLHSEKNVGTTIIVDIPVHQSMDAGKRAAGISQVLRSFTNAQVLLVEDNEINQLVAAKTLESWNISADIAVDGFQAIDMLAQNEYDLVLMDIQMPGRDGFETARIIREELPEPKRSVPILAMTASVLYDPETRARAAGMNGYVSKPFEQEELYKKIAPFLQIDPAEPGWASGSHEELHFTLRHIDTAVLAETANGNTTFIIDMLELFLQNTPIYISEMMKALHNEDFTALAKVAHTMKPTGAYIGVASMKELVASIEEQSKQPEEQKKLRNSIKKLTTLCEEIYADIALWKEHLKGTQHNETDPADR